jgi:hypothetical protein
LPATEVGAINRCDTLGNNNFPNQFRKIFDVGKIEAEDLQAGKAHGSLQLPGQRKRKWGESCVD